MPKDTPSMAKNKIKRSLSAIYDPHPSKAEVELLWGYFESRCAYCQELIDRSSRTGHLDHMLAAAEGGSNNIHNFALSCSRCNGDEKREEAWDSFLKRKAPDEIALQSRRARIIKWLSMSNDTASSAEFQLKAEQIICKALESFEQSVREMRHLRDDIPDK